MHSEKVLNTSLPSDDRFRVACEVKIKLRACPKAAIGNRRLYFFVKYENDTRGYTVRSLISIKANTVSGQRKKKGQIKNSMSHT